MQKILFICLGNICRSPAAEAVMTKFIIDNKLEKVLSVDSCGTSNYHLGELADERMRNVATERGYNVTSRARQFNANKDFNDFDYIITMDQQNRADIIELVLQPEHEDKIHLMTDFRQQLNYDLVPDPYYGDLTDFNLVIDILEDACTGLLTHIETNGLIKTS